MTHEQYRSALDAHHHAIIANGIKAGHSLRALKLSQRIEDNLVAAEGRAQMASEDPAMASYHHRRRAEYIASARALIALPDGREAHRLYLERTRNVSA